MCIHLPMLCVCVRACVRACVHLCVHVCVVCVRMRSVCGVYVCACMCTCIRMCMYGMNVCDYAYSNLTFSSDKMNQGNLY